MVNKKILEIDGKIIENEISGSLFACDLDKCKGACCTFPGEFGAPLADEEVPAISENLESVKKYLSDKSINIIENEGFIQGVPGSLTTNVINKKDCVFVFYDGNIAKCAIEKAYFDHKSSFRKPLSCHLFPIRVNSGENDYLHYQKIEECEPGRKLGLNENLKLIDSLKDALIRAYGEDFYNILKQKSQDA